MNMHPRPAEAYHFETYHFSYHAIRDAYLIDNNYVNTLLDVFKINYYILLDLQNTQRGPVDEILLHFKQTERSHIGHLRKLLTLLDLSHNSPHSMHPIHSGQIHVFLLLEAGRTTCLASSLLQFKWT